MACSSANLENIMISLVNTLHSVPIRLFRNVPIRRWKFAALFDKPKGNILNT